MESVCVCVCVCAISSQNTVQITLVVFGVSVNGDSVNLKVKFPMFTPAYSVTNNTAILQPPRPLRAILHLSTLVTTILIVLHNRVRL